MNRSLAASVVAGLAFAAAPALAQHSGDIWIGVEDGAVQTGAVLEDQTIDAPVRVFLAQFGDAGFPEFTSNPGFNSLDHGLATGSQFGLHVPAPLRQWNGTGFVDPGSEQIEVSFASFMTSTADAPADGFPLLVPPTELHLHYTFEIMGSPPSEPNPGIYLLELVFFATDPGAEDSAPFWIVFDYALSDPGAQQAAAEWVQANLVDPAPTCSADLDQDGSVGFTDLTALLGVWGACAACPEDLDESDSVGFTDLTLLLGAWGPCS